MGKGIQKRNILGIFVLLSIIIGVVFIENLNTPVTVQKQTTITNGVASNTTLKICNNPNILTVNGLCQLSTNQGNTTVNSSACSNGGIPVNGNICPASVVGLPANTTINTTPSTPTVQPYEQVQLIPTIHFIDDNGIKSSGTSQPLNINLNNVISPQGTSTPLYANGKMLMSIDIKAGNNEGIIANGTLFISINGIQLNPSGFQWAMNDYTNSSGTLRAKIQTPAGITKEYSLSISDNKNLLNQPNNNVTLSISNVKVQNAKGQSYSSTLPQKFYNVVLNYDANLITSKSSDGSYIQIYPSDDTFTISSVPKMQTGYTGGGQTCGYSKCGPYIPPTYYSTVVADGLPAGTASVYLESGQQGFEKLIGSVGPINSGNSQTISNIPRNADIRIEVSGGTAPFTQTFHTPVTQKSWSFSCSDTACSVFSP